ncbi:MAG: hypothetical protein L7T80_04760 [Arenicellales bacterium]|nr:hypothetical protein [Arenicellales bacterium]
MKRLAISIIASLVVGLAAPASAQQLTFHYGFIGQHDDQQLYIIEDRADLASGSKLKLNFEYPTGSWFYVCYLSSTDEHALLYASNTGLDANEQAIFDTVGWLALDENIGTETFTLIASERRLDTLETLFNNYSKASDKSRKRFAKRIARTLDDLQKQLKKSDSPQLTQRLDTPIMGGVTFRGVTGEEISQHSLSHKTNGDQIAKAIFVIQHH